MFVVPRLLELHQCDYVTSQSLALSRRAEATVITTHLGIFEHWRLEIPETRVNIAMRTAGQQSVKDCDSYRMIRGKGYAYPIL